MLLANKVSLITGGASGIGRATALLFAQEGATVAIGDVDPAGESVVAEILRNGGKAMFEPADVSRASHCEGACNRVHRQFGAIHILFNNAGIIRRASVTELSEQDWDRVMDVNVKSMFLMSREVIPIMTKAGGGSIINMASGWGWNEGPKAAGGCAAKGEVRLRRKG